MNGSPQRVSYIIPVGTGERFRSEAGMTAEDSFAYLWDGTDEGWVLIRTRQSLPAIYNAARSRILIIEDDEVYANVVQQMLDHGKEILERLPNSG